VSLNGTWMQSVAQSWLIYRLTESGFLLGLVGALVLFPNLIFGIYGGWLADRFARQKLLILAHVLAMLQALVLAVLTLGGWIMPWHILLLAFVLGLVQAIETPVRQSFLSQLVAREDLPNAIALNSSMFHLARFIGPAIAGVLVAWVGEGPVFLINAVTFIAIIFSLLTLRLPALPTRPDEKGRFKGILSGMHYAWNHKLIRSLLMLVAVVSLLGGATSVLMPIFIAQIFERGPESLGVFMSMLGAGSFLAALTLANQREFALLERRVALAAITFGIGLLVFAVNDGFVTALVILFMLGYASTTVYASSNALIQLAVEDHLRGRTMALFTICLHGMVSIGQLLLGSLADVFGAPLTTGLSGGLLLGLAILLAMILYRVKQNEV